MRWFGLTQHRVCLVTRVIPTCVSQLDQADLIHARLIFLTVWCLVCVETGCNEMLLRGLYILERAETRVK